MKFPKLNQDKKKELKNNIEFLVNSDGLLKTIQEASICSKPFKKSFVYKVLNKRVSKVKNKHIREKYQTNLDYYHKK